MKKRDEARDQPPPSKMTVSPTKMKLSPKKEPVTLPTSDKKVTHKTQAASASVKFSPKKPEVKTFHFYKGKQVTNLETQVKCFFPLTYDQSTTTSPDDSDKRKGNATAYRNYLSREGPRALGSKEIPQVTRKPSRNSSRCD